MNETYVSIQHDPAGGTGVKRLAFRCSHGSSSALVLPGGRPLSDLVALDLLLARHHRAQQCACLPEWPSEPVIAAQA